DFMMTEAGRDDTAGIALDPHPEGSSPQDKGRVRFDLANYQEQVFGESESALTPCSSQKEQTAGWKF
ncbi:MAG: hypothetical protein IMY80_00260, partial [Chloroflexi bacterium]|nr:hypothetical protein [Chloroflexota bacterium]